MGTAEEGTATSDGSRPRALGVWAVPLALIFGAWLWLAFSHGGYLPRQWLPAGLAIGFFGVVVSSFMAYPRRPRQLALLVLGFFGLYSLWVGASAIWAASHQRVWLESGRTFVYLLVLALAFVYLADRGARKMFRYLVVAGALVLVVAAVWRLWSVGDIATLFTENRFVYPVSYSNNDAALYLVGFWPLMWLAAGNENRALVRGLSLGLATALLGLAFMTQSRGAVWSLGISLVLMFIVSPARLRTLFYLCVPALLMVYAVPSLNRYWQLGPQAVGGGLGARTLVMVAVIAGFIGMVLALLEKWVQVSMRMKAIFGTVVIVGVLAGLAYGAVAFTGNTGGPIGWVKNAWRQFTSQTAESAPPGSPSRLSVISSSGRIEIWRVAWLEFKSSPGLGVGADNFVFGYDRLRRYELLRVQNPHSLPLETLAEKGVPGGLLAGIGMLLAMGGMLWPRCAAGWRGARETWLRRRKALPPAGPSPLAAEGGSPEPAAHPAPAPPPRTGANPRWCNPRWGNNSAAYGWQTALFVAVAYWLIHSSVDWMWQMAGVSIPALLFLAAAVSETDAHAGVLWPRWNRWLGGKPSEPPRPEAYHREQPVEPGVLAGRRTDQYERKWKRRERHKARRRRAAGLLQPPGHLSLIFRALLMAVSVVVVVLVALPYLSQLYEDSALGLAKTNASAAVKRVETALWLQPSDPGPTATRASIFLGAAQTAAASGRIDRAGAALDDVSLALDSDREGIRREPADWTLRYSAGVVALNLMLATEYTAGNAPNIDFAQLVPTIPGLIDWSSLAGSQAPGPGQASGSLVDMPSDVQETTNYRGMSSSSLGQLALDQLAAAKERNPLASQIDAAANAVRAVTLP